MGTELHSPRIRGQHDGTGILSDRNGQQRLGDTRHIKRCLSKIADFDAVDTGRGVEGNLSGRSRDGGLYRN